MDLGQATLLLHLGRQASVRRIVEPALDADLAPTPEGEVRGLVRLALRPARGAGGRGGSRHHRILSLLGPLLLLRSRPRRGLRLNAHARPRRSRSWLAIRGTGATHLHWRQQLLLLAPVVSG